MGHVYVTACGFSKRVIPVSSPYELDVARDGSLRVVVTGTKPHRTREVRADDPVDGAPGIDPAADVVEGPALPRWWLDTGVYAVPLPADWKAMADGDIAPAFFLVHEPHLAVFIQTAQNRPAIADFTAAGQHLETQGADDRSDWVEVSYIHEGLSWRQRHALLREGSPTMITAQGPADSFEPARALLLELVDLILLRTAVRAPQDPGGRSDPGR
jgi:hypothetical protein